MKKQIRKIISSFFAVILCLAAAVGCSCGDKQITKLEVKSGTLDYVYKQYDPVDFSGLKVIVTYNDESTIEVGKDEVSISEFNTNIVGTYKVTITYEEKSVEVELKVTNNEDELYEIFDVLSPDALTQRNNKMSVQTNEEIQYFDRDEAYVVGDDNDFYFFPEIIAIDDNDVKKTITSYKSVAKLYEKDGTNYTLLTGEDLTKYVENLDTTVSNIASGEIIESDSNYDFTTEAIGHTFKLEVRPYWLSEVQLLSVADYTTSIEFEVVDGYNVDDEKELAVMTNYSRHTDNQTVGDVESFLNSNGIARPSKINGIILHRDMDIQKDDLPGSYFIDDARTKLKDWINLYTHKVATGETFTFHGNYFDVKVTSLPAVSYAASEPASHATLFRFTSEDNLTAAQVTTTISTIKNVSFVGNANRSENLETSHGLGGLILAKVNNHTINFNNSLMRAFFIQLMAEQDSATREILNINQVKSYDSYQNSLFVWGGDVNIKSSVFKKAGGPLMILQHPHLGDSDYNDTIDSYIPVVKVDENLANGATKSVLESFVTGSESWFKSMYADKTAALLAALARAFTGTGKTYGQYVQDEEGNTVYAMNLVAVNMATGLNFNEVIGNSSNAKGSVTIDGKTIVNKTDMTTLKTELAKVPLVAGLVKDGVLKGLLAHADLGPALAQAGVTTTTQLEAFIEQNKAIVTTYDSPEAAYAGGGNAAYLAYNTVANYNAQINNSENVQSAVETILASAPVFQSQEQGFGFLYGPSLDLEADLSTIDLTKYSVHSSSDKLFEGDYLGMYFQGLGITLGYYDQAIVA